MIKLAIIGTGRMGTYHAKLAAQHKDIQVVALVNPSQPSQQLRQLCPEAVHVTNIEHVIDHVDAAIIASPTPTHFGIAYILLSAEKHVLVEKPITLDLAQAEQLFETARRNSCTLHIGHVEQYNPAFIAAQKHIEEPARLIRSVRSGPYHPRVAGDSVVVDLMIHDIDAILRVTKQAPLSVHAIGSSHASEQQADTATAVLTFASGTIASITVHRGAATPTRHMVIEQDNATLTIDYATRTLTVKKSIDTVTKHTPPADANPLGTQLDVFVSAIQTGVHQHSATHDLSALRTTLQVAQQVAKQLTTKLSTAHTLASMTMPER